MNILNKIQYWYLVVSLCYCSCRVSIASMFHVLSLLAVYYCVVLCFLCAFIVTDTDRTTKPTTL